MLKNRWKILILATWIQTTASIITQGIGPLSTYWGKAYNFSPTKTAMLVSAINIGPMFSMIFLGKAIDQYGERWILGISSLLLGITLGGTLLTNHYVILLFILLIVGTWYGASQPGGSKAIVRWFPKEERGIAIGIRQTGIPLGGAIAAACIPWLAVHYGVSIAIIAQVSLAIISGLIFLMIYRGDGQVKSIKKQKEDTDKTNWKLICCNKTLYPIFIVGMSLVSLQFILVAHFMGFLMKNLQISLTKAGLYLAVVQISGMLGRIVMAWISDKLTHGNRIPPLVFCIFANICSILFFLMLNKYIPSWMVLVLSSVVGFFGMGWYSLYMAHISENAPNNHVAYTVSIGLTLNQVAIVVAPILFGIIVDWKGSYSTAWIILVAIITLGGIMLLKLPKTSNTKEVHM